EAGGSIEYPEKRRSPGLLLFPLRIRVSSCPEDAQRSFAACPRAALEVACLSEGFRLPRPSYLNRLGADHGKLRGLDDGRRQRAFRAIRLCNSRSCAPCN